MQTMSAAEQEVRKLQLQIRRMAEQRRQERSGNSAKVMDSMYEIQHRDERVTAQILPFPLVGRFA